MSLTQKKNKPFNLIRKEVQIKHTIKVERDWYVLSNILVICLIVCLSIISFLFKITLENNLIKKKTALANSINQNLNTTSKELLKSRINVIEDKSSIYRDFLSQNFDTNTFYSEVMGIYPGTKVEKILVQPNSKTVDVDIKFDSKGYADLPKILAAIEQHQKFKKSQIKGINFTLKGTTANAQKTVIDEVKNTEVFVTLVSFSIDKTAIK